MFQNQSMIFICNFCTFHQNLMYYQSNFRKKARTYPALAGGMIPDEVDVYDLSVLAEHTDDVTFGQLVGQAAHEHPGRVLTDSTGLLQVFSVSS